MSFTPLSMLQSLGMFLRHRFQDLVALLLPRRCRACPRL